jgi:hypothetical protein
MSDLQTASPEYERGDSPAQAAAHQGRIRQTQQPAFTVHMHEREAFRAISSFGGTLESLNPKMVNNLVGAISNARADGRSREPSAPAAAKSTDEDDTITATAECSPPTSRSICCAGMSDRCQAT